MSTDVSLASRAQISFILEADILSLVVVNHLTLFLVLLSYVLEKVGQELR